MWLVVTAAGTCLLTSMLGPPVESSESETNSVSYCLAWLSNIHLQSYLSSSSSSKRKSEEMLKECLFLKVLELVSCLIYRV